MFGWINECVEALVIAKFGLEAWHKIKEKAACTVADGYWIRHQKYTDQSTLDLVAAATEVLGLTAPQILEAFGRFFHEFTMKAGYDNVLKCQGSNLRAWLSNVNALHDHLESTLPHGFIKPVFWCESDDEASSENIAILLHYYSKRGSLLVPLVLGLVKEVALVHFSIEIDMEILATQDENDSKYSTFRITAKDPAESWKLSEEAAASTPVHPCQHQHPCQQQQHPYHLPSLPCRPLRYLAARLPQPCVTTRPKSRCPRLRLRLKP
jgi:guanylate cyclase soluble subunit beta